MERIWMGKYFPFFFLTASEGGPWSELLRKWSVTWRLLSIGTECASPLLGAFSLFLSKIFLLEILLSPITLVEWSFSVLSLSFSSCFSLTPHFVSLLCKPQKTVALLATRPLIWFFLKSCIFWDPSFSYKGSISERGFTLSGLCY